MKMSCLAKILAAGHLARVGRAHDVLMYVDGSDTELFCSEETILRKFFSLRCAAAGASVTVLAGVGGEGSAGRGGREGRRCRGWAGGRVVAVGGQEGGC